MINNFADEMTEDVFNGKNTKVARKFPINLHRSAQIRLDYLNRATRLSDLKSPPGNQLHPLTGDRKGEYAIRINAQWRITFKWFEDIGASDVKIEDYH